MVNFIKQRTKKIKTLLIILKHCKVTKIKRRRPRVGVRKPTEHTTKLYVRRRGDTKLLLVCQKTFLGILNIPAHRIRKVSQTFTATGSVVQERGGDHTSAKNRNKLIAVKAFIEKFQCIESLYCRSTVIRKYLSSSLNIRKMETILSTMRRGYESSRMLFQICFHKVLQFRIWQPSNRYLFKVQ